MNVKKPIVNSISGIVVIVAVLVYSLVTGDEALLGRLVETILRETALPPIDDAVEQEIITIKIANDGDVVKHGDGISLAGETDFTDHEENTGIIAGGSPVCLCC
ncbi:MAG: hypothetical protein ACYTAF_17125 [Planctomycetota bacterium]|jgi:hypothetical protein